MSAVAALPAPPELANVETEAGLIGAILIDNGSIDVVADLVTAADFTDQFYRAVFETALHEHGLGNAVHPHTLRKVFGDDACRVLAGLTGNLALSLGARDFAREVRELGRKRRLVEALLQVVATAKEPERFLDVAWAAKTTEELVADIDNALTAALQRSEAAKTVTLAQAWDTTQQAIEDERAGLGPQGIHIEGLSDFNELTGDLRRGELMYLGGRPSMGKSALAFSLATGAARAGFGVAMVSLEMRTPEIVTRMMTDLIFDHGRSPTFRQVRTGYLNERDRELLKLARQQIDEWPLIITDPPSLNIGRLAMEIRRQRRRMAAVGQKLDLVIIDYLGLIKGPDKRAKRYEEVGDISRTLKSIAKECDVALIVLAQLNRECERREDKRPMLSDLRDAGDIEQDADHVMFVYRDEYYLQRSEPEPHAKGRAEWETSMGFARDRMEIIAAKVRNGEIGKRNIHFFGAYQAVRASDFLRAR